MSSCCVIGCTNKYNESPQGTKFYSFPRVAHKKKQRELWIQAVGKKSLDGTLWHPPPTAVICSAHFVGGRKVDNPNSPSFIPTIFPPVDRNETITLDSSRKSLESELSLLNRLGMPLENNIKQEVEEPLTLKKGEYLSSYEFEPLVNIKNEMKIGENSLLDGSSFSETDKIECIIKKELDESIGKCERNENYNNSNNIHDVYDSPELVNVESSQHIFQHFLEKPLKQEAEEPPVLETRNDEHENYTSFHTILESYDFPRTPYAKQDQISDDEPDGCEEDSASIQKYDLFNGSEDRFDSDEVSEAKYQHNIDDTAAKSPRLKKIHCQFCEYTASVRGRMKEHIDAVHLRAKNYKCEHCDFTTSTNRNLRKHIRAVHNKLRNHKCGHCEYTAYAFTTLKKHIMAVHEKIKSFKCEHCDFSAAFNRDLQRHIDNIHRKIKNHNCEHCDYSTYYSSCFKNHVNTVHHNLKRFKCKYCDHAATSPADISRHIDNVHHKLRNYKCEHCNFAAGSSSNLNRHVRAIHQKIKTKCEYCDFSTSQISNLKRHIRIVHCK